MSSGYGDSLDIEEVIARHQALLEIMVSERSRDTAVRDDLIQEGRIALWQAYQREGVERSGPYARTVARRRITEAATRQTWTGHTRVHGQPTDPLRQQDTESLDAGLVQVASEVLDGIDLAYHHGEIVAALNALTQRQREYVALRFWGGMTEPEIAARMSLSVARVQVAWSDAKVVLRERLAHLAGVA